MSVRMWCRCALVAACLAPIARADTGPEPPKDFSVKAIDDYLAKQVTENGYVGLSVALVRDGKLVLAKGYGRRSLPAGEPVETDTLFAAGSITKQFTCACVLLLAEEGKLSVRDKVSKYYRDLTRADDITLYDLMTHAAGYPDYYPLDFVDRRLAKPIPPDELLKEYAGGKLDFEPGTGWSYSNTGFVLLGRVVERVSGKALGEFMAEHIFKPLGMDHTVFDPGAGVKGLATGHTAFALGDPEPAPREAAGWLHGAGAIYTTPSDLAKWDLALVGGKVLKPASYRLMTTPRELKDGRTRDYGCGLGVTRRRGELVLRHTGAVSGYLAYNSVIPRTNSALILMANSEHQDARDLFDPLFSLLLQAERGDPEVPRITGLPAKDAALDLLHQFQAGQVKRDNLGEEYSLFLTAERVRGAKERLKPLGEPVRVEADPPTERGGMEVVTVHFTFESGKKVKGLMYRTPDGKVQEFLIYKD